MKNSVKIAIAAAVVLVLGGAGLFLFLRDDAPEKVSLDAAVESVGGSTDTTAADRPEPTAPVDGIDGTWTVDEDTATFDVTATTGTFAGFRIEEELASIGSTTAVGRTGDVTGGLTIDGTTVTEVSFAVDLTTVVTDQSRRDDKVQSALDTVQFPTATFKLTEPIELDAAAADGAAVSATAVGELTIHGVTQAIELPIEAQLVDGTIALVASTTITFADFGVAVPTAPIVVSVEDTGILEVQLLLTRVE